MILALTGLLTPLAFWVSFGLYDRFTPKPRMPQNFFDAERVSPEERMRTQILRGHLLDAARMGDWLRVRTTADDTCGADCPSLIAALQAEAYWRLGQRTRAADLWFPSFDQQSPAGQADILAIRGDTEGYKRHITSLLASVKSPTSGQANDSAWACVLLPNALPDYTAVVALAEQALQDVETPVGRGNTLNTLGVALYRAGRFDAALAKLQESELLQHEMMNVVFIALCYHQLGDRTSARREADHYYQLLRDSLQDNSRNRAEYVLFEKELSGVLPARSKKAITP